MKYDFIKVGATVCWHDPEGISEGEYKVASVPDNLEDDSVVLITSDFPRLRFSLQNYLRFNIIGYGKT